MRKQLAPLVIKRRHNPQWPGKTVKSEVLQEPGRSFGWVYPEFPEDLAFFRDGKCF